MKTMYYHRKKIFFIPLIIAGIVLFVYVTMLLWNALLPGIFGFSAITFWQAAGLLILTRLLFGFGHHKGSGWHRTRMDSDFKNKIRNMSPEEKKEFFRKMHYNREMWHHGCHGNADRGTEEKVENK